ncbi:hypothetical protein [Acanthopleuribacter pedis]|uniref:Uncharacterized protein n=1 Tax=Acanthopleuribacter pedis TaxID=442870 RepID=A0A8J7QIA9_9BACT|nr:hypothetical protein [Acanthopleuribacter pedis]MBO1321221.1 hypothetical protein [Acanthopleuribacter pedis]
MTASTRPSTSEKPPALRRFLGMCLPALVLVAAALTQCTDERPTKPLSKSEQDYCFQELEKHKRLLHTLKVQRMDARTPALGNLTEMEAQLLELVPEDKRLEFLEVFDHLTQNYHNRLRDLERGNADLRRENQLIHIELNIVKGKRRREASTETPKGI